MQPLDTTLEIETPERVRFRHRVAGPGSRGLALAVDWLLQAVVLGVLGGLLVLSGFGGETLQGIGAGVGLLALFVVSWFYAGLFEATWAGRTPGKALFRLRVVRDDGARIGVRDALLRTVLRGADALPVGYVVGVIAMLVDPGFRRLGDHVAGTLVVVETQARPPEPVLLDPPLTEAERQELPVGVVLRREELRAVEELLRRASRLGPDRTEELAGLLAPTLTARQGVVAPTALRVLQLAWARATGNER